MFTGIIEETGIVTRIWRTNVGYNITFSANIVLEGVNLGDSIAVNGTCLTVTHFTTSTFTAGLAPETRARTNLAQLREGNSVNLERSVTPTTRMGGHFVQGHVDDVGTITQFRPDGDALWVTIQTSSELMRYIVPKGFIALDGTSLTVVDVMEDSFTVTLVAYTQSHIILPKQKVGYTVNIEVDILGKYVEKMLETRFGTTNGRSSFPITQSFLQANGFR